MTVIKETILEDHKKAKQEVAFLLKMLSHAIENIVGKASGVVGRKAGSAAAKKMPLFFETREVQPVIQGIKIFLEGGFDMSEIIAEDNIELTFRQCALREVCEIEKIPLGDNLCMLFHNYMNGMIMELTERAFTMSIMEKGDICIIKHWVKSK